MKKILLSFSIFLFYFTSSGQVIYTESFSEVGAGAAGNCTGASITTCATNNSPTNAQWFLFGNFSDMENGDFFQSDGSDLVASDLGKEICFETSAIDISGQTSVSLNVVLSNNGGLGNNDYVDVSYTIDGVTTVVPNYNGFGNGSHTLTGNFPVTSIDFIGLSGSSLRITVCIKNSTTGNGGTPGETEINEVTVISAGPLPVELTSFESKVIDNNSVILFWNTASEENNSHFVIEHSRDGQRFNEIGQKTGMGTTTIPHTYSMRHERLAKGFHYYRLKQVDFDGKYEYSNIISAKLNLTLKDVSIAPNPAMEQVTVFIDTPISIAASYQLVNMQKEIMLERTVAEGNSSFQIDMTDLPAGVYFMRFYVDQQVISKKIVKLY